MKILNVIKQVSISILILILSFVTIINISNKDIEVKATETQNVELSIYRNNVAYSDKLNILYAVSYQNIDINTNKVQLLFFDSVQEQYIKGKESYVSYSEGTSNIGGTPVLIYYSNGIAAKEMTEDIYAVAYVQIDGKDYYSEVNKFSVLEYALKIKETSSNTLQVELVLAMLKYGSLAQQALKYNLDKLADATYYNINVVDGSLSDGFTQGRVKENEVITLKANDKEGYIFTNWTDSLGNIVSIDKEYTFKVTETNTYTANYYFQNDDCIIIDEIILASEEAYDVTSSTLELPETVSFEYEGNTLSVPISFDVSTFKENQIGTQILSATITDNSILVENNIQIISIHLEVNVLPYTFSLSNNEYSITGYFGDEEVLSIPSTFKSKNITNIKGNAFYNNLDIREITIPSTINNIEYEAFLYCDNVEKITTPFIGENDGSSNSWLGYIFGAPNCQVNSKYVPVTLKEVIITEGTTIGNYAFYNCESLTNVTIPNSVTSIGNYAFYNCESLTSIAIPNNVTSIGENAFNFCGLLTNITIPNNVTRIKKCAFAACRSLINIEIPNSVKSIEVYAFSTCTSLKNITIPSSVTNIEEGAFRYCTSLRNITIPNGVISIGKYMFESCESLRSITIPSSVTNIEEGAFRYCTSLESIEIPNSVTSIVRSAFENCTSLENVYYEGTIEDWCKITFSAASNNPMYYVSNIYMLDNNNEYYEVKEIEIPNTITTIGNYQFCGFENVTKITIPNSVTSIGSSAFNYCTSLESVEIPNSVTSIGNYAFNYCTSLESVEIPNSVTSIGIYAFYNCTSLTNITIPNSVTSIGIYAFNYCTSLTIYCEAESQPSGWHPNWNKSNCPVVWGYNKE